MNPFRIRLPLPERLRTSALTAGLGVLLIVAILTTAAGAAHLLRGREIAVWKQQLDTLSLVLAEHATQTMASGYAVLDGIAERVRALDVQDAAELRVKMATAETFQMLRDKIQGLPQVDVATIVAVNGDIINFTRSFPTPAINLADRDYFQAHQANPQLGNFISNPVRNKGNGKWTFYLSRRLNDANGQMIGLLLVGISIDAFASFYAHIGENLGEGAAVGLWRRDFALLTRWPQKDELIGKANRTGVAYQSVEQEGRTRDVVHTGSYRFADGAAIERIVAVRVVERYPLIVTAAVTSDLFLAGWRRTVTSIAVVTGGCVLVLIGVLVLLIRLQRAHELELDQNRKLNRALRDSEFRANQIIENAPDAMLLVDGSGAIRRLNSRAEALFGHTRAELTGQAVEVLVPEPLRSRHRQHQGDYGQHPDPRPMAKSRDLFAQRSDGSLFPVEVSLAPIKYGEDLHVIVSVFDISERRALEAELAAHRHRLEELVTERTAELVAARGEAERLARVKSEFLANMSHEIRTPLNAVLGLARIGARDSVAQAQQQTFGRIVDAGEHLLGVINDILDISKIEAGKLVVEARPFRLAAIVGSASSFIAAAAANKGVRYEVELGEAAQAWVAGDPHRVQQILVNLLSNAVKFTERGEVRLSVRRDGDDLSFTVSDTGIGMTQEQVARVFTPFEQADTSTTRRYGGTGLGLAISLRLATLMGGGITVESSLGAGSRFTLRVPLPEAAQPAAPYDSHGTGRAGHRLDGIRVLAAEDVDVNRLILEDLLQHEGAEVEFAEDGRQAVERLTLASAGRFDVVLMDVQMPEMDGYAATRRVLEIAPGLPVIGLTAHALAEERERCLAAGMVEHVSKPIDIDQLMSAILGACRPGSTSRASGSSDGRTDAAPVATDRPRSLLDWSALMSRFGGRRRFVERLAETALAGHRDTPERLRAAAQGRNFDQLSSLAHTLKSTTGNLLAFAVQELAARSATAARAGDDSAWELAEALADATAGLLAELAAGLEGDGPGLDGSSDGPTPSATRHEDGFRGAPAAEACGAREGDSRKAGTESIGAANPAETQTAAAESFAQT